MAVAAAADVANTVVLVKRFMSGEFLRGISVCNRAATANTVRIWVVPADTIRGDKHALVYDLPIRANETILIESFDVLMTKDEEVWAQGGAAATLSIVLFNNIIGLT